MEIRIFELDVNAMPENIAAVFDTINKMMTDDAEFEKRVGIKPPEGYTDEERQELRQTATFEWVKVNLKDAVDTISATFESMITQPTKH